MRLSGRSRGWRRLSWIVSLVRCDQGSWYGQWSFDLSVRRGSWVVCIDCFSFAMNLHQMEVITTSELPNQVTENTSASIVKSQAFMTFFVDIYGVSDNQ